MRKIVYLLFCVVLFGACDEEIATSIGVQPQFSADTLNMGTFLAGNSSPTYCLKLYNRNSKTLKLSSVALRNATSSGFRINVDGMNGTTFDNPDYLRIAAGDSLFVFVEATFAKDGKGIAQHEDFIDVTCNGSTRSIVLRATSRDVLSRKGHVVNGVEEWERGSDVQIFDSLVVAQGAKLIIHDSVTVFLHDKADIIVHGTIEVRGTRQNPTTIRGDRTDNMFPLLAYDELPSQWGSIYLKKESVGNVFTYANIRGMDKGIIVESEARFENCRLRNSGANLLTAVGADLCVLNCELANSAGHLLDISGGCHEITHCTLANYHFASAIQETALRLSNKDTVQNVVLPLEKCNIVNTIVWGKKFVPDVTLDYYAVADSVFSYRFDHCLLHAEGDDDENFIATLWNQDPLFEVIEPDNYKYDFHLLPESPCVGNGGALGALIAPFDIDGNPRAATPAIGCYEGQ